MGKQFTVNISEEAEILTGTAKWIECLDESIGPCDIRTSGDTLPQQPIGRVVRVEPEHPFLQELAKDGLGSLHNSVRSDIRSIHRREGFAFFFPVYQVRG